MDITQDQLARALGAVTATVVQEREVKYPERTLAVGRLHVPDLAAAEIFRRVAGEVNGSSPEESQAASRRVLVITTHAEVVLGIDGYADTPEGRVLRRDGREIAVLRPEALIGIFDADAVEAAGELDGNAADLATVLGSITEALEVLGSDAGIVEITDRVRTILASTLDAVR